MEGEQVLVGFAQIGIIVAGFAGLVGSLQDREHWTRAEWVYLQTLVVASIGIVFIALLPFVPFYLSHDQQLSLRLASGLYVVYAVQVFVRRLVALRRARALRSAYGHFVVVPLLIGSAVANIFLGSIALYVLTLLLAVYFATTQFRHFVVPRGKFEDVARVHARRQGGERADTRGEGDGQGMVRARRRGKREDDREASANEAAVTRATTPRGWMRILPATTLVLAIGCSSSGASVTTTPPVSPSPAAARPSGGPLPPELLGTWKPTDTASVGTLIFTAPDKYAFETPGDIAGGNVLVNGDEIAFFGAARCGLAFPGGVGRYRWTIGGGQLAFVALNDDPCGRVDDLKNRRYMKLRP